jgi:hypothetical protein
VLGLQVPLFGGRLQDLRDLRRQGDGLRADVGVPAAAVPGHHQGRYALYLQIEEETAEVGPTGPSGEATSDDAVVHVTLFRVDAQAGSLASAALRLLVRDLSIIQDAEAGPLTPAALSDWLTDLLPSCFLVAPTGEVLLVDWFRLDLMMRPELAAAPPAFDLRACGIPGVDAGALAHTGAGEEEGVDLTLLDPATWSLPVFADLLAAADLTVSARGRYLILESSMPVDGELANLAALLDTAGPSGIRALVCDLVEEGAAAPAQVTDDVFPILRGERAAPGLIA